MSVGAVLERVWKRTTGARVRDFWCRARMMAWTLFGEHVYAGWVGTTPPRRMRQFHA
jgi:hypothetical protein